MTNQELFNKAYLGLKGQGFQKSVLVGYQDRCMYRGPNRLKCAAGHIFTDKQLEQYTALKGEPYEGRSASIIAKIVGMKVDRVFLDSLQNCHDLAYGAKSMKLGLTRLAEVNGLTVPE
jgi:hypothetical protein